MKTLKAKVSPLENKNQFVITTENAIFFQSYKSVVARYEIKTNTLYVGKDWDYSNTTRKHFYIFVIEYLQINTIENELYFAKSKRAAIKKLIKEKVIKYDKNLD